MREELESSLEIILSIKRLEFIACDPAPHTDRSLPKLYQILKLPEHKRYAGGIPLFHNMIIICNLQLRFYRKIENVDAARLALVQN